MNKKESEEKTKKPAKKKTTTPAQSAGEATFEDYKPYIQEMRGGFWKTLVLFVIGAGIGIIYYKQILSTVMGFFQLNNINVVLTSPYQFIVLLA